jgi:hypothetical protein
MPNTEQEDTQQAYLERQIVERLARMESSVEYYRSRHYRYPSSAVLISAVITILSGVKLAYFPSSVTNVFPQVATDVVLILGAISTVAAAFGAFFSPQQSWYLNAEAYTKMRALQAKLEFVELGSTFPEQKPEIISQFFAEYQAILDEYNQNWKNLRQKSK